MAAKVLMLRMIASAEMSGVAAMRQLSNVMNCQLYKRSMCCGVRWVFTTTLSSGEGCRTNNTRDKHLSWSTLSALHIGCINYAVAAKRAQLQLPG
jgi:hypothetical protein